jgi:parvulin-like peptidyl-prolyl isomerase
MIQQKKEILTFSTTKAWHIKKVKKIKNYQTIFETKDITNFIMKFKPFL